MALISKASLLMVPSTYEPGKLYNVLPSGNRAPDNKGGAGYDQTRADFDFDRGSNAAATRIGSDGLLKKYQENLLLQSNQFDTTWTNINITHTSGQTGYDGSSNAWKSSFTAGSTRVFGQTFSQTGVVTISIYVKAGNHNFIQFVTSTSVTAYVNFDISSSSAAVGTEGTGVIDSNITSVGNDWYRCSMSFNNSSSGTIYVWMIDSATSSRASDVSTDGNILIQSAQLETGLVATDYLNSTSVTAKAGVLIDLPRINYDANGENGALLLEPSRQQLIQFSEYFGDSYWTKNNVSVTDNAITSPEGVDNACLLIENTATSTHEITKSFTNTLNADYCISIFAKANTRDSIRLSSSDGGFVYFNLATGEKGTETNATGTIEPFNNGWYKCSVVFEALGTNGSASIRIAESDGVTSYTGQNKSIYIFGIQYEAGSYVSSYIPNHGESGGVTRAADEHNLSDITSLIGTTQGSWFLDWEIADSPTRDNSDIGFELSSDDNRDELNFSVNANGEMRMFVRVDNTYNEKYATTNKSGKWCLVWNGTSLKLFQDGVEVYSDASVLVYNDYTTYEGVPNLQYKVKQILLFPTALTDAECISLTS